MRVATRILLWKLGAAAAALALLFALMHVLLPGLARRREQQRLGEGYERVETERLEIWVPRGTPLAPLVAAGMEEFTSAFYKDYGEALRLRVVDARIKVRLFATQPALVRFAGRQMKQDLSYASGFYDPVSWSIALTLRPPRALLALLFHETTHLLMDRAAGTGHRGWSLWLAEGMAVFFEHSQVTKAGIRLGGLDRRQAARILALAARGRHVPLRDLLRGGAELFHSERGVLCYHEAGTLVAYLLAGADGRHRDGFFKYYRLELERGAGRPDDLEHTLGIPIEQLEREWLTFLQRTLR